MSKNEIEKKDNPLSNIDLLHYLLNKGSICYLPAEFDIARFVDKMMEWMLVQNLEAQYNKEDQLHIIRYIHKSGITNTIGLSMSFSFFFVVDNGKLFFEIKPQKWIENKESGFSLVKMVNDPRDKEIKSFIFQYLIAISSSNSLNADFRNLFIEKLGEPKKIWFFNQFPKDEVLFVFLEITSPKKDIGPLKAGNDLEWFVLFSSSRTLLLAFDSREQLVQQIEIKPDGLKVKKELGRNPVFVHDMRLLSTRSNSDFFYLVQHIYMLKPINKTREIVILNWLYNEKNEQSNQFAIEMQQLIINNNPDPYDEMSLFYMEFTSGEREKVFSKYTEDEKLLGFLNKILDHADTLDILTDWIKKWNISFIDSIALNDILIKAVENAVQANNILPFHRYVRENFLKKNDDSLNTILFDISFAKHLIKCGLGNEAKKVLLNCLKKLPDETILDLLPAKDSDLTGNFAGQTIRVNILEILAGLETQKEAIAIKCEVARLQPLVNEKIDRLIDVSELTVASKAKTIKMLLLPEGLVSGQASNPKMRYNPLSHDQLDNYVQHPASRKNGSFSNFSKWLATAKVPDLSMLKSYTEKLSAQKHPQLNETIADIRHALNIENLEVYIAQGDKSIGITSFESKPQFLIVGGDHLNPESPNYLNTNELRFAVGVELAHLYFKHARITSSDIWKGAFEKGYFLVDSLLSVFPAVGMFSKSLQAIGKLNQISTFLQKTERLGKVSSKSKEILKSTEKLVDIYKSKLSGAKGKDDGSLEFLVTSRIMQLTAHRCAFAFSKDLKSAIRAMFLVSKKYYTELPVIEKYGLTEYLKKQNEDGTFRHQELAIRLADLFSFYLSDEYESITKIVEAK